MSMLPFNTNNVNSYLIGISTDQVSLNQFATELNTNFLNALTSRWVLATWQINQVNALDPVQQNTIAAIFQQSVNTRQSHPDYPMEAMVMGIPNAPSGAASGNRVEGSGSVTYDSTGKVTVDVGVKVSIC